MKKFKELRLYRVFVTVQDNKVPRDQHDYIFFVAESLKDAVEMSYAWYEENTSDDLEECFVSIEQLGQGIDVPIITHKKKGESGNEG